MNDEDFSKHYEFIDWVTNTEGGEIEGHETTFLRTSFELLRPTLIAMESMAREIENDKNSVGFEIGKGERRTSVVPKGKKTMLYFYQTRTFFNQCGGSERYLFSPHVEAVNEALIDLFVHPHNVNFRDPESTDRSTGMMHAERFNEVVAKVAEIVASSGFKERMRIRTRAAKRNEAKGLAIEQKVFDNKARRLVLMLHFGYQEPHRGKLTLAQVQKHREKFFNNCRSNKLLRGICDYIWKLEEGDESGLHFHVLIFYSADHQRDVTIAKLIGDYWVKVTDGKGQYWNSNADKWFHAKYGHGIGTGEINWDDDDKREALRTNIRYTTKADQFLKMKYGSRVRQFGTSEVDEKKKSGRPRVVKAKLKDDLAGSTQPESFDETGAVTTNSDAR